MLGSNVVVKSGAFLHRAVVHDNVFIGPQRQPARLRHRQEHRRDARRPGSRRARSSATSASSSEEAIVSAGVKVYPFKTVEAGAVVNTSRHLGVARPAHACSARAASPASSTSRSPPSSCVRLASAYATTLKKGVDRHHRRGTCSRAARALKRAVIARAQRQRDQRASTSRSCRCRSPGCETARGSAAAASCCAPRPGDPQSRRHRLPRRAAAPTSPRPRQRKLERVFAAAGVPPGVPGRDRRPVASRRGSSSPTPTSCCAASTRPASPEAGLKVVVDTARRHRVAGAAHACSAGSASTRSPSTTGWTRRRRPRPRAERGRGLQRLGELVASSRAAFGVRFDPVGERIALVDETRRADRRRAGAAGRARPGRGRARGRPGGAAGDHDPGRRAGGRLPRRRRSPGSPTVAGRPDRGGRRRRTSIFGGDGRGGFVVPEFCHGDRRHRGLRAAARPGRADPAARCRQIDARIPQRHMLPRGRCRRRGRPRAWSCARSSRRPGDRQLDTTDGVRVRRGRRQLGAGAARPGRAGHPPVGRGRQRLDARPSCSSAGPRSCSRAGT